MQLDDDKTPSFYRHERLGTQIILKFQRERARKKPHRSSGYPLSDIPYYL